MKIHEYQALALLERYGIPVPLGEATDRAESAGSIAEAYGGRAVVKAQIHAGGRGKGGGIRTAGTPAEAEAAAMDLLGMNLVTPQTGPEGRTVRRVLVQEGLQIRNESYLGMAVDCGNACVTAVASAEGGIGIETTAAGHPGRICRIPIDPGAGLQPSQARRLAHALGLSNDRLTDGTKLILGLYSAFMETDASLAEINPLVITHDNRLLAADARMHFDDNALYRHPEIAALRDIGEEDPAEAEASAHGLGFVRLDGNVGCMVNGAGLAMATMDLIRMHGAVPANFLDVGGSASAERVEKAFRILLADRNLRAVLINIFGGIVQCDRVAAGVVEAAGRLNIRLPVVVRFAGNRCNEGADILRRSGLRFAIIPDLSGAAREAAALAAAPI